MKKNISLIFTLVCLYSCTSNTIFKEPKNLIPKDTMSLLIQDMTISNSAKFIKNKKLEKNINYMPFVYDKYKIDSLRFQESSLYYLSKIDVYLEIITNAKNSLEKRNDSLTKYSAVLDSVRKDSIKKSKTLLEESDLINKEKRAIKKIDTMLIKQKF